MLATLIGDATFISPFPPPPLTAVVSLVAYVVSLYEPIRATELAFRK